MVTQRVTFRWVSKPPEALVSPTCSRSSDGCHTHEGEFRFPAVMAQSERTTETNMGDLDNWLIVKEALFLKRGADK